jgi:hypothetical protein
MLKRVLRVPSQTIPTDEEPEWQLIDFNIGNAVVKNEVISINKASGQYRDAGSAVKSAGEQSASESFNYKWTTSDDYEMLIELISNFLERKCWHDATVLSLALLLGTY